MWLWIFSLNWPYGTSGSLRSLRLLQQLSLRHVKLDMKAGKGTSDQQIRVSYSLWLFIVILCNSWRKIEFIHFYCSFLHFYLGSTFRVYGGSGWKEKKANPESVDYILGFNLLKKTMTSEEMCFWPVIFTVLILLTVLLLWGYKICTLSNMSPNRPLPLSPRQTWRSHGFR